MADRGGIVVTGASTGIGECCAVGLAQRGYTVFAGVRKQDDADRLQAEGGANLTPIILDVTNQDQVTAAAKTVEEALGDKPLRGLFNNAGVSVSGPLEYVKVEDVRWQLEVNCVAQVAVTQAFIPLLRKSKGRIVTTSSVGGFVATPMLGPYNMSKFAIEAFNDSLRVELAPAGIEVVLIQPAAIRTKIWDKGLDAKDEIIKDSPPEMVERYEKFLDGVTKFAEEGQTNSSDPQVVLDALIDALEAVKPKTRYVMGVGAGQRKFLKMLPDRMRDRVLLKAFGLR